MAPGYVFEKLSDIFFDLFSYCSLVENHFLVRYEEQSLWWLHSNDLEFRSYCYVFAFVSFISSQGILFVFSFELSSLDLTQSQTYNHLQGSLCVFLPMYKWDKFLNSDFISNYLKYDVHIFLIYFYVHIFHFKLKKSGI